MLAHIIVNVRVNTLDQLFTYRVGRDLEDVVCLGARVVVPFGKGNYVDGLVWQLTDEDADEGVDIKSVLKVMPDIYTLTKSQMILLAALKKHFFASYQSAFFAVLPSVQKLDKIIRYTVHSKLDNFSQGQVIHHEALAEKFSAYKINKLIKDTILSKQIDFEFKVNEKKSRVVIKQFDNLEAALTKLTKHATKQRRILTYISHSQSVLYDDLRHATQATKKDVDNLVARGFITVSSQSKSVDASKFTYDEPQKALPKLSDNQRRVIDEFNNLSKPKRALLHGVTGSGKTRVYIELAKAAIDKGQQVLVLVPEISLTPQLIARFRVQLTERIGVLHTHVSASDKVSVFNALKRGNIDVIIGARSAVFAPFTNLGLIIVDESHETSFKSETHPRYDTLTLIDYVSKKMAINMVLGSATPSAITYYKATCGEYALLTLPKPVAALNKAAINIVDIRGIDESSSFLSPDLLNALNVAFNQKEQAIILHNRKGLARYLQCHHCGYVAECVNCDIPMTVYRSQSDLQCHYCGYKTASYRMCPTCGKQLSDVGIGVQRILEDLQALFPSKQFERIDADITRSHNKYLDVLKRFADGQVDALVGTQVLAKGLDFPNVTLVGVVMADQQLNMPGFTSQERAYQLLSQVAGRAGRHAKKGNIFIQTFQPEHNLFDYIKASDYSGFIEEELKQRKALGYPPYQSLITLTISSESEIIAQRQSDLIYNFYADNYTTHKVNVQLFKPLKSYYYKIRNRYHYTITIKCSYDVMPIVKQTLKRGLIQDKYNIVLKHARIDLDIER